MSQNFTFLRSNAPIGRTAKGEDVLASPEFTRALAIVKEMLERVDVPAVQLQQEPEALPAVQIPQQTFDSSWPVGSVFVSVVSTDPASLLGFGSWVQIGAGRFPVGYLAGDPDFGTLGATGGAKTKVISAHTGTAVADHANHTHSFTATANAGTPDLLKEDLTGTGVAASGTTGNASGGLTHSVTQPSDHTALDVLPPYLVLNFWQRTA